MTPNENPSCKTGSAVTTEALVTVLTPLSTAIVEIGRFKSSGGGEQLLQLRVVHLDGDRGLQV